jgi:hypothetical protein
MKIPYENNLFPVIRLLLVCQDQCACCESDNIETGGFTSNGLDYPWLFMTLVFEATRSPAVRLFVTIHQAADTVEVQVGAMGTIGL